MNLLNKISIWFIIITLLVTPISMYISYNNIKKELNAAEIIRLTRVNEFVAEQLRRGESTEKFSQGLPISVSRFNAPFPSQNPSVSRSYDTSRGLTQNECLIRVSSYRRINDQNYQISSFNYVSHANDILKGMLGAVAVKMLLIIAVVGITGRILSRIMLKPFRKAMEAIRHFNLQKPEKKLPLLATSTKEFKELNLFLQDMTDKAVADYTAVKEFSENASHELQTPLAVIQSKIELLAETNIDAGQASLLSDMQNATEKLSRINRSLTLLTRLDNHEFVPQPDFKFCTVAREAMEHYADRCQLKNITVNTQFEKNVRVDIHPALAEILVNNLLTNAIRHNVEGGAVTITLTRNYFQVGNTGPAPEIPVHELFQRFKKSNQSAESVGLGLAIVQQICVVSQFSVQYEYREGWHTVTVFFSPPKESAPTRTITGLNTERST